jgi:hypothetical protein
LGKIRCVPSRFVRFAHLVRLRHSRQYLMADLATL